MALGSIPRWVCPLASLLNLITGFLLFGFGFWQCVEEFRSPPSQEKYLRYSSVNTCSVKSSRKCIHTVEFYPCLLFPHYFKSFCWIMRREEDRVVLQVLFRLSASLSLHHIWYFGPLSFAPQWVLCSTFCLAVLTTRALTRGCVKSRCAPLRKCSFARPRRSPKNGPKIRTPEVHLVRFHVAGRGEVRESFQVAVKGKENFSARRF